METKNCEVVLCRLQTRLRFLHLCVYNPIGLAGGLAVLWNDYVFLSFVSSTPDYFNMTCTNEVDSNTWRLTCLHALTVTRLRHVVWQDLINISLVNTLPWACIDDFNEILYHWKK